MWDSADSMNVFSVGLLPDVSTSLLLVISILSSSAKLIFLKVSGKVELIAKASYITHFRGDILRGCQHLTLGFGVIFPAPGEQAELEVIHSPALGILLPRTDLAVPFLNIISSPMRKRSSTFHEIASI